MNKTKYLYNFKGIFKDIFLAFMHFPLNLLLCVWAPCVVLFGELKQSVSNNRMVIYNTKEEIHED